MQRVVPDNAGRFAVWTLAVLGALGGAGQARAEIQPAMRAYQARLPVIRRQIDAIRPGTTSPRSSSRPASALRHVQAQEESLPSSWRSKRV